MRAKRNTYDHRLRELVCRTRDLDLAERLFVPRSTAKSRLRREARPVLTAEVLDNDLEELGARILRLERRVEVLVARATRVLPRRKLLAWELATKLDPSTTCRVLEAAGAHLPNGMPTVACDSGIENVNGKVNGLVECGRLRRVLAQVELSYSNSMIEAWW